MKRAIALLLVLICIPAAHAATVGAVKVTLRSEVEVRSGRPVHIKDIATISAPMDIAGRIGDISVASGPLPGAKRTVGIGYVRSLISGSGITKEFKLAGPENVVVTAKCVKLTSQEIAEEAKSYLMDQLPKGGKTYDIIVTRQPRDILLADDTAPEIRARTLSSSVHGGPNTIAIDIIQGGKSVATTSATMEVKAVADVLVATTAIAMGEAITTSNTSWEQREVTRQPQAIAMTEGGALQDWIAHRPIRSGSIISASDVVLPPAIRQGDTVTLVVKCGSVTLRAGAQAKESGRIGDTIRVLPAVSEGDVRARITESGVVEINR